MQVLYGVVGEGMGHATRSRVILEHLLQHGIQVRVVVSGRAHNFLREQFENHDNIEIEEIHGMTMNFDKNTLDVGETIRSNLENAPAGLKKNVDLYARVVEEGFSPDLVFSDFESWAYLYAMNHRIPLISIDNMQVMNRCKHDDDVTDGKSLEYLLIKTFVKFKLPGAYHYLVTSFFFPPVRKKRTSLVPPILRPEILAAKREPRDHILVYPSAAIKPHIVELLRPLPHQFRIYGMDREGSDGNITLRPFSQEGFIDDFRSARAVIAGGGFSMMSEAVHLHVPMLTVPIEAQFEQELNARYLRKLGYGDWTRSLDTDSVARFLEDLDSYNEALARYPSQDNSMILRCIDELLRYALINEPAPDRLESPAMQKYFGPPLPDDETF